VGIEKPLSQTSIPVVIALPLPQPPSPTVDGLRTDCLQHFKGHSLLSFDRRSIYTSTRGKSV